MTQYEHYELKRIDAEIAELEARISLKQEQRREIINRKDLNKVSISVSVSESQRVSKIINIHSGDVYDLTEIIIRGS